MSTQDQIRHAVEAALAGAQVEVTSAGGGHFALVVVWAGFAGKRLLDRHRAVLAPIAPLMAGNDAPVHAIDSITAREP